MWSPLDPNSYAPPALPFTKPTEKFNLTTVTLWKVAVIDRESSHVFDDTVVAITDEKNESEGRRCLQQYQKKPKKYGMSTFEPYSNLFRVAGSINTYRACL